MIAIRLSNALPIGSMDSAGGSDGMGNIMLSCAVCN